MEKIIIFELSKPIKAHGEVLTKLELREPNGKDVRECGFLLEFGKGSKGSINAEVVASYIEILAGIPPSSVNDICARDMQLIGMELSRFFAPESPLIS